MAPRKIADLMKKVSLLPYSLMEIGHLQKIAHFGDKGKPIALLFDENWAPPKIDDFGDKGKPIALLLYKNLAPPKIADFDEKAQP